VTGLFSVTGLFGTTRIYQRNGIDIRRRFPDGRGIFAQKKFEPGDTVEIAPLILLPEAQREVLQWTSLYRHYFLPDSKETPVALGLGYSSLYDHAARANAAYRVSLREAMIIIKACKPIRPGEEITLNYNGSPDDETLVYRPEEPEEAMGPDDAAGEKIMTAEQTLCPGETGLYSKAIKGKGRGVFCRRLICKDECIETSPLLILPAEDHDPVNCTLLSNYFFNFNKDERTLALSLGFGSLYNHARDPNGAYFLDRESRTMTYYALEDIPPGREICINYSGEPGQDFLEWFSSRNINLIEPAGKY
jgi:hypothetical protein